MSRESRHDGSVRLALGLGIVLTAISLNGVLWSPEAKADSFSFKAIVADVEDGDTLMVLRNKVRIKVQIAGIDAPELDQPYGLEAKRHLTNLARNQLVVVTTFSAAQQKGRLTGQVKLKDKRSVAKEMLKAGLAWSKRSIGAVTELDRLEAQAKAAGRGLWAEEEPIPPWEWREGRRPR